VDLPFTNPYSILSVTYEIITKQMGHKTIPYELFKDFTTHTG